MDWQLGRKDGSSGHKHLDHLSLSLGIRLPVCHSRKPLPRQETGCILDCYCFVPERSSRQKSLHGLEHHDGGERINRLGLQEGNWPEFWLVSVELDACH